MTSSSSIISIANRSLVSAGSRTRIQSLNEGSVQANTVSLLFNSTFESLARTARWACLRAQASLTLIAAAQGTPENVNGATLPLPPPPYLYQYAYPTNCLAMRYIVPSFPNYTAGGSIPLTTASNTVSPLYPAEVTQIPFTVAYSTDAQNNPIETILTNQSQAQAVYTVNQPNPVIWDSLFEAAYVASLAVFLISALNLNMPLMSGQIKIAEGAIAQARTADGNEGVTSQNRNADWMTARIAGSGGLAYNVNNNGLAAYTNMCWPS